MKLRLGIKSDPIEYRYSFDWLFGYMEKREIHFLQLGSFFELYHLPDEFFADLKEKADARGVRIKSCFTSHRELGGFFAGNAHFEAVARRCYERYIEIGAVIGADYVGSNPGAIYRDKIADKPSGITCYLENMVALARYAKIHGLSGLTIEPMSSLAEPPALPAEINAMIDWIDRARVSAPSEMVDVYICGDVSHGLADFDGSIRYSHEQLFEHAIPMMVEFHFKNTDSRYESTFGFGGGNSGKGIVDLRRIRRIICDNGAKWPVDEVVGYLEIGGPKLGRDYSDRRLESMLDESVHAIRAVFTDI